MDTIKDMWNEANQKSIELLDSFGSPKKDYSEQIYNLPKLSINDQEAVAKVRSGNMFGLLFGSLTSGATAIWATGKAGGAWRRARWPLTLGAIWVGGTVGIRQAGRMNRSFINEIENPELKEIMQAHQNNMLSSKDELSLRNNVIDKIDYDLIKEERIKSQKTSKNQKVTELREERERIARSNLKAQMEAEDRHERLQPHHEQTPAVPLTPHPKLTGPTPYLRQRLPEAIEAEKRRKEGQHSTKPEETTPVEKAPESS